MTREEAHQLIDRLFDADDTQQDMWPEDLSSLSVDAATTEEPQEPTKPAGRKVVRTKNSGDRVYMLDEIENTRHWVTNPVVLEKLGFKPDDVEEVEESVLLSHNMAAAIYKVDDEPA